MQIVFTSLPNEKSAKAFAQKAVKLKLASCANYWKINSVYFWEGKMRSEKEFILEAKTTNSKKLMKWIEKTHPYKCPMIYSIKPSITAKNYENWIKRSR